MYKNNIKSQIEFKNVSNHQKEIDLYIINPKHKKNNEIK